MAQLDGATPRAPRVVLLVTRDTKAAEADYLIGALARLGVHTHVIDTAIRQSPGLTKSELMRRASEDCGTRIQALIERGARAIVGMGGGTGSWIAMNAMQTAPFGFPKVMISTLAFDPRDFCTASDIIVVPSVADLAGLNDMLRRVLDNCAAAVAGMARVTDVPAAGRVGSSAIGVTALGITDGAVSALRRELAARGHEVTSFHANGFGGRAFERWTAKGAFRAVIDLTTHEINSMLFGGSAPAGDDRLKAAALHGVPQVVVPGGIDVLSRGPIVTLTPGERERAHYAQGVMFTHLRATRPELRRAAAAMAERLNERTAAVRVVLPTGGFSREGEAGGAVHDPAGDRAFIDALCDALRGDIPVFEEPWPINDPRFAAALGGHLDAVIAVHDGLVAASAARGGRTRSGPFAVPQRITGDRAPAPLH